MRAQLVPPDSRRVDDPHPCPARARAVASEMPQPISLTTTGTPSSRTTSPIFGSSPEKLHCPSGWIASWSGFRWRTRASAPIISTACRHSATPIP